MQCLSLSSDFTNLLYTLRFFHRILRHLLSPIISSSTLPYPTLPPLYMHQSYTNPYADLPAFFTVTMKANSSIPQTQTLTHRHISANNANNNGELQVAKDDDMKKKPVNEWIKLGDASFMKWRGGDILGVVKYHPVPCIFGVSLLFFMAVEYTLLMIPPSAPPFDIGFVATVHLHRWLASCPHLNTLLAGLNTVFVGMQTGYILWTWLVEGRPRATIAALFMFTFRGILGYSTQLPLPEGFLGSGVDFPVGNVSFFLFYSGHVAASIIASLDMKRMQRWELACIFDVLNMLQVVRLLSTRGHYTIDLAVGVGAGILFDSLAAKYERGKRIGADPLFTSSNHENGTCY